jgi:hypothetical protein
MRKLISLLCLLCISSVQATQNTEFTNKRIKYTEAQINNQFDLALRILDYRFPLSSVTPVAETQGEITSMGDFFQKKIDDHAEYQTQNQQILEDKIQSMEEVEDPAGANVNLPNQDKEPKDIAAFFDCLINNTSKVKRIAFLKRKANRTLIENNELEILKGHLNSTRGRDGIASEDSILCGIHLGKASISKFSEIGLLKLIYALNKMTDLNSKKHLMAVAISAHHTDAMIEVQDLWMYSFNYLRLKAFTSSHNLPDRDKLIDTVIAMRDKLLPSPVVETAGAGTSTVTYRFKEVRQKMIDSYNSALDLLNAPE